MIVVASLLASMVYADTSIALVDSGVAGTESLSLASGHGQYFFIASTAGEAPLNLVSWSSGQDLEVLAPESGNLVVSAGRSASSLGSFSTTSVRKALAGIGLDGYVVSQRVAAQRQLGAQPPPSKATKPIAGPKLALSYSTTSSSQVVVILAAASGAGQITATHLQTPLQDETFGATNSAQRCAAAIYWSATTPGKHTVALRTKTYGPNSGSSLGAVAYILLPSPAPTVTTVAPESGPEAGGTAVTISGNYLDGATGVSFAGTPAMSYRVLGRNTIEAVAPPGSGTVDVTVTTDRGTSAATNADRFTYLPPPAITEVKPNSGPEPGETALSITGSNLTGVTAVRFGSQPAASFKLLSPTAIEAVSPKGSGTVDITVTSSNGTSATSNADQFTYVPPHPIDAYWNYGPYTPPGHAMCRGNPARPESMPGGTGTQTFTIPSGVASLSSAVIQFEEGTVTGHVTVKINGEVRATAEAQGSGDTHFSWPAVPVHAGDQASISITFSATYGKIITLYAAAVVGGTFTFTNSCSDGAPSGSLANGMRAIVSGMST